MSKRIGPFKMVKSGNVRIPIYRVVAPKAAKGFEFKVAYYSHDGAGKSRKIKTFADCADAEKFAENLNAAMTKGDAHTLTLTGEEFHAYQDAMSSLAPSGVPLMRAASEYAGAIKKLNGVPLAVAVDGYLRAFGKMQKKNVQAVVDEMIAEKEANKRKPASAVYVKDLRGRLDKFAESFHVAIDEITPEQIEAFLGSLKGSGRTQFNYGRLIRTLFNYAEKRNYLAKDSNPFEDIDLGFTDDSEIEIFTPKEMQKILETACPEMIPFFALGGFAGLRHTEIKRLDWSKIGPDKHPNDIEVTKKENKKTRQRRLVPIQPNLAKWLAPYRKDSGPVVEFAHTSKQIGYLAEDAEIEWKHNAMRHSFTSYRLAILKDEGRTALESGHKPEKLHTNYKALVTEDAAKAWFSIEPTQAAENVISMPKAA